VTIYADLNESYPADARSNNNRSIIIEEDKLDVTSDDEAKVPTTTNENLANRRIGDNAG